MLINLLPDFFAVLNSTDSVAAYHRYFETHRRLLEAYWHNYVLDPDGPHFRDVVQLAALADRSDLRAMLERTDVVSLARSTEAQCGALLEYDADIDVVLMVGVGAANAGELVVDGRGTAFVCLEHFTSVTNPETQGLGLEPELIPLWFSHEITHAVRYTSRDGEVSVFDSTIILEYLDDAYPDPPMRPASAADRARVRMLEEVMDTHYEAINWGVMEIRAFQRATGDAADRLLARASEQIVGVQAWLARHLGAGAFFGGKTFGWADCAVAPYVHASATFGSWTVEGAMSNALDARYASFATYNINQGAGGALERFLTPGAPRAVHLQLRRTIGG